MFLNELRYAHATQVPAYFLMGSKDHMKPLVELDEFQMAMEGELLKLVLLCLTLPAFILHVFDILSYLPREGQSTSWMIINLPQSTHWKTSKKTSPEASTNVIVKASMEVSTQASTRESTKASTKNQLKAARTFHERSPPASAQHRHAYYNLSTSAGDLPVRA